MCGVYFHNAQRQVSCQMLASVVKSIASTYIHTTTVVSKSLLYWLCVPLWLQTQCLMAGVLPHRWWN